jgi:hypothetical protein
VYQFHNICGIVNLCVQNGSMSRLRTLILHEPPMLIPPMPPEALEVDDGMFIAVLVGAIPDIAMVLDDIIMLWSIFIIAD